MAKVGIGAAANRAGNRDGVTRWLRVLLVASLLIPAALFTYASIVDYRWQFDDARYRLRRTTDIVYEHADKVFDTHRLLLAQVEATIGAWSDEEITAREGELHARFHDLIDRLPQVENIAVLDRTGHLLAHARTFPASRTTDFSDRDFFIAERERQQDYITSILGGHSSPRQFFGVVSRRNDSDGAFAGVILVSVDPQYFQQFYERVLGDEASSGESIALIRQAGDMLVRAPPAAHGLPQTSPAFRDWIAQANQEGYFENRNAVTDGSDRLIAYRKVGDYPLYVAATLPRSTVLAAGVASMAPHLIFGIPATIALFVITLVALRRSIAVTAEQERRRAAETALHHAQRLESVGQLTGGVAHDFNNLLTAILGNLDLALMNVSDAQVRRVLEGASRAAERGAKLTESLLAFSRRQQLSTETIDATALVQDFAALVRRTVPETVTIALNAKPQPLWCRTDAAQLEAALLNLVVNARDAMAENGGTLTFTLSRRTLTTEDLAQNPEAKPGEFVAIAVSDTGIGMSQTVIERAFEPFFTTKEIGKGSGLGLSQVFGFVRQIGGHVTIESAPRAGTAVCLFVPASAPPMEDEAVADPAILQRAAATLLVVEDDADVRGVTSATLERAGFTVVTAADGHQALAILTDGPAIDLVLSDVVMPNGMSGAELGRRARRLRPGMPVLLISGYTGAALAAHGADEFEVIRKPFRQSYLLERVTVALQRETVRS